MRLFNRPKPMGKVALLNARVAKLEKENTALIEAALLLVVKLNNAKARLQTVGRAALFSGKAA